jgi:hypothetical protein
MAIEDQKLQALHEELADLTGRTVEEIAAMSRDELIDATARMSFRTLALTVAHRHDQADDVTLMEEGPVQQAERAIERIAKLHDRRPLWPVHDTTADLFGFGRAPVQYVAFGDNGDVDARYFLLSDLADPLNIPLHKAHAWAEREEIEALRAQREHDEETGTLGWDQLNDVIDLGVWLIVDDPEARPDASGERWSTAGDWLVSDERLLSLMTASPWCAEFMTNARPLMAHAFIHSGLADRLGDVPTYMTVETYEGEVKTGPTGETLGDHIREDAAQMPVEEAAKRAMRGPSGPLQD